MGSRWMVEHGMIAGRDTGKYRGALAFDDLEHQLGIEMRNAHIGGAAADAAEKIENAPRTMKQRYHRCPPVALADPKPLRRGSSHESHGTVAQQCAFWKTRCTGGVKQGGGFAH